MLSVSIQSRGHGQVNISGMVSGISPDKIHLQVIFYPNYLTDIDEDRQILSVPVYKDGSFEFNFPSSNGPIKFTLIDSFTRNVILPIYSSFSGIQIAFPGDSVAIKLNYIDKKLTVRASGRGSAKYDSFKAKPLNAYYYKNASFNEFSIILRDYIDSVKIANSSIKDGGVDIILSDYIGKILSDYSMLKKGIGLFSRFNDTTFQFDRNTANGVRQFNDSLNSFVRHNLKDFSGSYEVIKLRYLNLFIEYLATDSLKTLNFNRFFNLLIRSDTGLIRDRILCYTFLMGDAAAYFGSPPQEYKDCVSSAIQMTHNNAYKGRLMRIYKTRTQGAEVWFPKLLRDSSNVFFNMDQLKGKVVFVDMWPYQCGGCAHFAKAFHAGVFEKLRSDTNFVVVSIMVDGRCNKNGYLKRLRGEGTVEQDGYDFRYTFPEYINLYAGKGYESIATRLDSYWDVYRSPSTFLIGKDGKLFSSTVPFFDDPNSLQSKYTYELIKRALD